MVDFGVQSISDYAYSMTNPTVLHLVLFSYCRCTEEVGASVTGDGCRRISLTAPT